MKVTDILFELESNYVKEEDISLIEDYMKAHGINLAKIDLMLEDMGYDSIFEDLDTSDYSIIEKIQHRKHLND